MPKPKHLKTNKLIAAFVLTCIIVIAGSTIACALVNVQTGYTTTKMALTIPTGFKVLSNDAASSHIIYLESNLTWSPMPNEFATIQNPSSQAIPAPIVQYAPGFYQNHHQYLTTHPETPTYQINQPDPPVIYTFTNETGTFLIVKY
jgi:hypothetical protein